MRIFRLTTAPPHDRDTGEASRVRAETVLLLAPAAVILALGVALTVYVRSTDLLPGELEVTRWLIRLDFPVVHTVSNFLDFIAKYEVAPVLFVALLPLILLAWGRRALLLFAISGSLTGLTTITDLADRTHPPTNLQFVDTVTEASGYPSGHVVYSVLVFGMIGYIAATRMQPGVLRLVIIVAMAAIAALMGPSRIIELDHWPADVVGGYLLSLPFLLLLIWLDRHLKIQSASPIRTRSRRARLALMSRIFSGRR